MERSSRSSSNTHILQFSPLFSFSAIIFSVISLRSSWFMSKYVCTTYKINGFILWLGLGFFIFSVIFFVWNFGPIHIWRNQEIAIINEKKCAFFQKSKFLNWWWILEDTTEPICTFHVPVCVKFTYMFMHTSYVQIYKCHFWSNLLRDTQLTLSKSHDYNFLITSFKRTWANINISISINASPIVRISWAYKHLLCTDTTTVKSQ